MIAYINQLMENVPRICRYQKVNQMEMIKDLNPFIEGLIWSYTKLEMEEINDFIQLIRQYLGMQYY